MPFIHIYLKKNNFKHTYEITARPGLDDVACQAIQESFRCTGIDSTDAYPGAERVSITCPAYINRQDSFGVPGDLEKRSKIFVTLLQTLDEGGWEILLGRSIHDHDGIIFRKKKCGISDSPCWTGKRRCDDIDMADGCSFPKNFKR